MHGSAVYEMHTYCKQVLLAEYLLSLCKQLATFKTENVIQLHAKMLIHNPSSNFAFALRMARSRPYYC